MPAGARNTAAVSAVRNAVLEPAVPPPPVAGAPVGAVVGAVVAVGHPVVGHVVVLGDGVTVVVLGDGVTVVVLGDGVTVVVPGDGVTVVALGSGVSVDVAASDGESEPSTTGFTEGDSRPLLAAATPLVPPTAITASDTAANSRSRTPLRRRTGSVVCCDDPSSIGMCTTTPLRSQSRCNDLELLGFRLVRLRVVRATPAVPGA
jgi:hypothetical protein